VLSNFQIDIFAPLCRAAGEAVGVKYEFAAPQGRALRRIADHVRAITFCIHEGVAPGSEKESYVVRQLLRRAVLEGFLLGQHDPFLSTLVPVVIEQMKVPYPELKQTEQSVRAIIADEESQFLGIVDKGVHKFERLVEAARSSGQAVIPADAAFDLHQTDGFLIELTEAMAAKHNLAVDLEGFKARMQEHKLGSGAGAFLDAVMAEGPLDAIRKTSGGTVFLGYEQTEAEGQVVGIIAEKRLVDELVEVGRSSPVAVVLDRTPFYGEAGGQVGDTGVLQGPDCEFRVLDTQRDGELILHIGHLKRGRLALDQTLTAQVDAQRRAAIRRAHSATHLLHYALRQTLGENATQRGSKVEADSFRFDFAHRQPLSREELTKVEDIINARIAEGAAVSTQVMDQKQAKNSGAIALFGEKYPDRVRVVSMGNFSQEFCGGTHLSNTGQVGLCKISHEEPVAKGVRRVTALTGAKALHRIRETEDVLRELVALLKTPQPEDLPRRVQVLQDELRAARRELDQQATQSVAGTVDELIAAAETVGGVRIISHQADAKRDTLRDFVDQLRAKSGPVAIVLGTVEDGKVALTAAVSKDLIARGLSASDCVKTAAKIVGGGGGGRPDMAEAGGRFPDKLPEALAAGAKYYREKLAS
jgi:alanyl-tRNA synthetase